MFYQNKNFEYTDARAYDRRGELSILENYVLKLWQPFLKNKIAGLSGGKVVADLGCGTGEYAQGAKNAKKIYAVDISAPMLKLCREKLKDFPQAEIIQLSVFEANLPQADLIITIGVWEYVNPKLLFKTIEKMSQKGSKIIVVFPNIYNDLNLVRSVFKMKRVALRPGFIKKLFKADFRLIESANFGMVSWVPKKLQFLALPVWKFCDFIWRPFQKFLPLGINIYYLFERK
ncbi:MAG: Methyltransferase type 11 [Candidatus Azambacteria bacterium GW2011_GWA2_42_9]|uniref:Methyltransferase type 11 n=3 Tax=Candidatus Azamiibacteriota TaxID=1752741 RepID=A0A0G0ZCL0_9BACT|nr:MAG: Methyltransferase type 11 [Candidatus Azambacteria bacterium GW2011_GWB1_42_17]KKS46470.1 MAG: Methyltransferase type 11 [Candidatus Azambacteria bacterium GW2011_GWA1_42_19]KKS75930.1 MAG: Methyltransferase type 11 [Candidatus Azambacteria bacterium GW2011_GWA2_42_9]KKS88701.1 MAG: Methyltransferase type 11 [Parcubacteria group bacterium GW2011_GWC1_43_11]